MELESSNVEVFVRSALGLRSAVGGWVRAPIHVVCHVEKTRAEARRG